MADSCEELERPSSSQERSSKAPKSKSAIPCYVITLNGTPLYLNANEAFRIVDKNPNHLLAGLAKKELLIRRYILI